MQDGIKEQREMKIPYTVHTARIIKLHLSWSLAIENR